MRSKRIREGILTGTLGRTLGLLAPFLVMPAMLQYLGPVNFGIWMTAVSITSMALFMDFGIGNGLLTRLSQAHGNNQNGEMRKLISTGYASLSGIAILASTALIILTLLFLNQGTTRENTGTEGHEIILATSLSFLLGIPISAIQRILMACQKNIEANLWPTAGSLLAIPACYVSIYLQMPIGAVVAIYSITPLLILLVATAVFFRSRPELRPSITEVSKTEAKQLASLGSKFFTLSIITSLSLNSDNLILAINLGPETVTNYSVPAKIGTLLGLIVTTLFLPLWSANGEAIARKDFLWVKRTTLKASKAGGLAVAAAGALLTLIGEQAIELWMGKEFANSTAILAGFSLSYLIIAVTSPFNMVLNSCGIVKVQIYAWAIFGLISILAKYIFIRNPENIWQTPFITALCFSCLILPIIVTRAAKVYRQK